MSLQAILEAIYAAGEEEARQIESEARAKSQELLAAAEGEAEALRLRACQAAERPAAQECARIRQQARLESWRIAGAAREALIARALEGLREELASLRSRRDYPAILGGLAREALAELAPCLSPEEAPRLEADARDAALLDPLLSALGRAVTLDPGRRCWGGVRATSADGRVAVDNTLESRLERAMPSLRLHLATVFDAPAETMEVGRPTLRLDASAWPTLAGAAR